MILKYTTIVVQKRPILKKIGGDILKPCTLAPLFKYISNIIVFNLVQSWVQCGCNVGAILRRGVQSSFWGAMVSSRFKALK